ncbi:hypothetical protein Taro_044416 [Colocasia esculenta]|uniref:Disease resistance N-terminal domain-containing protein n=1 Tax=Colocasia esculenta TaxID=4460 RepID=A0A843X0S4_COLES|nr:hypothetical protein [Colocasia esculenta]
MVDKLLRLPAVLILKLGAASAWKKIPLHIIIAPGELMEQKSAQMERDEHQNAKGCSVHICLLSMAIGPVIAAGEAIISASVDVVQNYVFSVAKEEFQSMWYLKDEIKRTSELVETIQDGVEDAEKKQLQDEDVRKWIGDLKNAGYDMEDVLYDYRVVVASVEDGQGVVTRWMSLAKDALCLVCGIPLSCLDIIPFPLTPRVEIAHRLRSINRNLVEINQRKAKLSLDGVPRAANDREK